jgi:magnesium chelatase subunit D
LQPRHEYRQVFMSIDAPLIAALFAVDPAGLGGVAVRAPACAQRDEWLGLLRTLLPEQTPLRRIPLNISDTALLGGLDLGATLHAGRPIAQQGVLAQADGGVVVLAMAERLSAGVAARLAAVLDTQEVAIERDGLAVRRPARLGVVALDEGALEDEQMPAALLDRLAFRLILDGGPEGGDALDWQASEVAPARALLRRVSASDEVCQALCAAALALGIASLRAPLLALRVARAAAALAGLDEVCEEHVALAARLVLAPRATQLAASQAEPESSQDDSENQTPPESARPDQPQPDESRAEPSGDAQSDADEPDQNAGAALAETVLEAARAAIPPGLLAALKVGEAARGRARLAGRSGAVQKNQTRDRPLGARRGEPRGGARLNVIETLRAAAPWQRLRQREQAERELRLQDVQPLKEVRNPLPASRASRAKASGLKKASATSQRIYVRREDFHVTRFRQLGQTTTLFVVDASGSSALNRLAEAKGAVELLLADCYVRRDRVAVLAFRGKGAELLLPPTRSLARAKRSLAGLPGGGGTPLAAAIDAARELADQISRHGETPIVVLLTDGRGNVARDGGSGRVRAGEDALAAARQMRLAGFAALLLDTSPQPQTSARLLAQAMGATYLPLPYAGAQLLSQAVRAASGAGAV